RRRPHEHEVSHHADILDEGIDLELAAARVEHVGRSRRERIRRAFRRGALPDSQAGEIARQRGLRGAESALPEKPGQLGLAGDAAIRDQGDDGVTAPRDESRDLRPGLWIRIHAHEYSCIEAACQAPRPGRPWADLRPPRATSGPLAPGSAVATRPD